jgi:hypothetical protein
MKKTVLMEICMASDGHFETKFNPCENLSTIIVGVALASATRVASAAFIDLMKLDEDHLKPIQEQIAHFYNQDLKIGTLGEEDNTKAV